MRKESESENRVQLTMAKQQGTLIEVHNLPNDDYFNVGFVVALDPVFCLMISIDWDGKINGLIAIRIKSILYTERHSDYLMTVSEKLKLPMITTILIFGKYKILLITIQKLPRGTYYQILSMIPMRTVFQL